MNPSAARWRKSSRSSGEVQNFVEVAVSWRRSSRSQVGGNECIEVAASWRKSSRSRVGGNDCVEIGGTRGTILIRDSKDAIGPRHMISPAVFRDLIIRIKRGELDLKGAAR